MIPVAYIVVGLAAVALTLLASWASGHPDQRPHNSNNPGTGYFVAGAFGYLPVSPFYPFMENMEDHLTEDVRFALADAEAIAQGLVQKLAPHCLRIEVAGSIRRRRSTVKDVEIVAIPKAIKRQAGFFEEVEVRDPGFVDVVEQWEKVKGDAAEGKYTQRIVHGGIKLDLFLAEPENWGVIFAIRTGSARFSHHVLARRWSERGYKSQGGYLYPRDHVGELLHRIQFTEEEHLFEFLDLPFVDPVERE